jgi:hypothetical protein
VKVPWPTELLQHQQRKDLAAAAPTAQQLLGAPTTAAAGASDTAAGNSMDSVDVGPSMSPRSLTPAGSRAQSFLGGGNSAACRDDSLAPVALGTSFGATLQTPQTVATDSQGSLPDVIAPRNGSHGSKLLWQRQQSPQPSSVNAHAAALDGRIKVWSPFSSGKLGITGQQSSQDAASSNSASASGGTTAASAWGLGREGSSLLRPATDSASRRLGTSASLLDDGTGRPGSPPQQQQQQQQQWLAPASVLVPGLRVRMGVASGVLGDREDCSNSKVLEAAKGTMGGAFKQGVVCMCCSPKFRFAETGLASGLSHADAVASYRIVLPA